MVTGVVGEGKDIRLALCMTTCVFPGRTRTLFPDLLQLRPLVGYVTRQLVASLPISNVQIATVIGEEGVIMAVGGSVHGQGAFGIFLRNAGGVRSMT